MNNVYILYHKKQHDDFNDIYIQAIEAWVPKWAKQLELTYTDHQMVNSFTFAFTEY